MDDMGLCSGSGTLILVSPSGAAEDGEVDEPTRNFNGGSLGNFASSSRRLQSLQTKWKSSRSASLLGIPRHLLCCHTLQDSHATL